MFCILLQVSIYVDVTKIYMYQEEKDEFYGKRGNPGSWTKKLCGWLAWSILNILNSLFRL